MRRAALKRTAAALLALAATATVAPAGGPWLDRVRAFEPGPTAGFGADQLPDIIRGRPEGLGITQGSTDVVSLGHGGTIVVSFDNNAVVDGEGDDLVIFENPFLSGSLLFAELAFVEVSADGREWAAFPHDAATGDGLAGRAPVLANSQNRLDPLDKASGGDRFDLADVGLDFVRFVRIRDVGDEIDDAGNHSFAGNKGGFDLDAAAALHSTALGCIAGSVSHSGQAAAGAKVVVRAEGERRRRRTSGQDGSFRVCRLRPELDYSVTARHADLASEGARVYIDRQQLRVHVDLVLE